MSRTPLLAGNWKMHGTRAEATALAGALAKSVGAVADREVLIAPPFTALDAARDAIAGTRILLGGQNVHGEDKGAFTGEVSAAMLLEAGCTHVIVGHSERRQYYGESDAGVNARLRGALRAGLIPIVCVGETLAERQAGETMSVIARQIRGGFAGMDADRPAVRACWPTSRCGRSAPGTPRRPRRRRKSTWQSASWSLSSSGSRWRIRCESCTEAASNPTTSIR